MYKSLNPGMIGIQADLYRTADLAARHGFEGVDATMADVAELVEVHGLGAVKQRLADAGVRPGWCGLLPSPVTVDQARWDAGVVALGPLAALARDLGYTRTYMVVMPFHETLDYRQTFDLHVARLRQVAPVLADHGIRLGLEYVGPKTRRAGYEHTFVHDMAGMLELCKATGEPNLGLLLDAFHWYTAGEGPDDIRRLRPEQVVLVHASDAVAGRRRDEQMALERELPGATGLVDLAAFFDALRAIGYDGPVTCEPFNAALNEMDDDEAARLAGAALDDTMGR